MKNSFFTKSRIHLMFLALFTMTLTQSCGDDDEPTIQSFCNIVDTDFQQLVNDLLSTGDYEIQETMDLAVHSYTFKLDSDRTLCKVGYKAQEDLDVDYLLAITDLDANTEIYSGSHSFSDSGVTYESVGDLALTANTTYKIERLYDPGYFSVDNIGQNVVPVGGASFSFPISHNGLTLLETEFYIYGGPIFNTMIPYIDLAFEE